MLFPQAMIQPPDSMRNMTRCAPRSSLAPVPFLLRCRWPSSTVAGFRGAATQDRDQRDSIVRLRQLQANQLLSSGV